MGKDILYLEDEEGISTLVIRSLKAAGHNVFHAIDVAAAKALADGRHFDLIISDQKVPGNETGLDFVEYARKRPEYAQTPILLATSEVEDLESDARFQQYFRSAEDAEHLLGRTLAKPFIMPALHEALNAMGIEMPVLTAEQREFILTEPPKPLAGKSVLMLASRDDRVPLMGQLVTLGAGMPTFTTAERFAEDLEGAIPAYDTVIVNLDTEGLAREQLLESLRQNSRGASIVVYGSDAAGVAGALKEEGVKIAQSEPGASDVAATLAQMFPAVAEVDMGFKDSATEMGHRTADSALRGELPGQEPGGRGEGAPAELSCNPVAFLNASP